MINFPLIGHVKLNSYAVPAAITLGLLAIETVYLGGYLPETKGWKKAEEEEEAKKGEVETKMRSLEDRKERLRKLEWIHFGFLFFFSGTLSRYFSEQELFPDVVVGLQERNLRSLF